MIKHIYDNISMDVNTLQGQSSGRVNMNKLNPCQEPSSTQAYALQILAWHIMEAEIKADHKNLENESTTTQSSASTPTKLGEEKKPSLTLDPSHVKTQNSRSKGSRKYIASC